MPRLTHITGPDFGLPKLGGNYESKKSSAAAAPASRKLTSLRPSRKPLSHIVAEGAYEPEPFHPKFTKDMSVEKERLRDLREFPDRVVEKDSFVAQIKAREEALRVEDEIERRKAELEGGVDEFSECTLTSPQLLFPTSSQLNSLTHSYFRFNNNSTQRNLRAERMAGRND